jgi:hypothetical protein
MKDTWSFIVGLTFPTELRMSSLDMWCCWCGSSGWFSPLRLLH